LKDISEYAVNVHNMRAEDIYEENISAAFLCQAIGKMTSSININNNNDQCDNIGLASEADVSPNIPKADEANL
jgi:hypothetical protein